MTQFLDRRPQGKNKNILNRQRFLNRFRNNIKQSVSQVISKRSITKINQGEKIVLSKKELSEPRFTLTQGGIQEYVLPGNKVFVEGDKINKPDTSSVESSETSANNKGKGEDTFTFELTREEFLDLFFDDLELPDMIRKQLKEISEYKFIRSGISTTGTPSNIHIVQTFRHAIARKIALSSAYQKKIDSLKREPENEENQKKQVALEEKIKSIPFLEDLDIRYKYLVKRPYPATQAVMFCLMDVSGSMDETKKEIAKRFFILLYLFLTKNYAKIKVIFIRHHTSAKEVDEQEFFYSRETGGTVVSSALELMLQKIQTEYSPHAWNIYVAQASDGDNWNADSPYCRDLIEKKIISLVQYFAYVEIIPRHHQSLWNAYTEIAEKFPNFAMKSIQKSSEVFPVLQELFTREKV